MEHVMHTLIVITLLQLCRAEISEIIPGTWFSANAINDGYSPKQIMEIFSTEPTPGFSPTKPIIVLPSHSSNEPELEVTHHSTSSPGLSSTTYSPTTSPKTTYESSTSFPSSISTLSSFSPSVSTVSSFTSSTYQPSSPFSPETSVTTAYPPPANFPIFNFPSSPQLIPNTHTTLSGLGDDKTHTYDVIEPNTVSTIAPFIVPQTVTAAPPYLVIYQNQPQTTTAQSFTETSSRAPLLFPAVTTKKPANNSITLITNSYSEGTSRPTVTFRSTPPTTSALTTSKSLTISTKFSSCDPTIKVTRPPTPKPARIIPGPPKGPFSPNLKIRIVAPKGSITNVKINPTTTTKRPSTRKTKVKKLKNTHETCVENCRGKREPICGIPLGTLVVEPKMLKGFPSICHMACHNSFKKEPYEKIVDGRCGRVRTRIVRIDVNSKVQKEELKKSEYSVINNGPQTVVEFAGSNVYERKAGKH